MADVDHVKHLLRGIEGVTMIPPKVVPKALPDKAPPTKVTSKDERPKRVYGPRTKPRPRTTPESRHAPRKVLTSTIAHKVLFLEYYAQTGSIQESAKRTGISPSRHYEWMQYDPDYPKLFKAAREQAVDSWVDEARRRGVDGVEQPTGWYRGEAGGYVTRHSDNLLMFLIKGERPEKYRENYDVQVNGSVDHKHINSIIDVDALSDETKRMILIDLHKAGKLPEGVEVEVGESGEAVRLIGEGSAKDMVEEESTYAAVEPLVATGETVVEGVLVAAMRSRAVSMMPEDMSDVSDDA